MRTAILTIFLSVVMSATVAFGVVQLTDDDTGGIQTPSTNSSPSSGSTFDQNSGRAVLTPAECLSPADIYERVRPSVVLIRAGSGSGSGVIFDEKGYVLTNYHVVQGANNLDVIFSDDGTAPARVIGSDPANDLAVIQVDAPGRKLAVAELGDSSSLRVGESVLALGNPFQLEGTLTQGIVSATGRTFSGGGTRPIRDMIQTDAAINPGNSGGPLLDCEGKVVGINSILENPTGQDVNVGVAFAVPIDTAKRFLPEMLDGKSVSHPHLGITGDQVTPAVAKDLGLPVESGAYITLVSPNTPAQQAGLRGAFRSASEARSAGERLVKGGDVIVAVDGQEVKSMDDIAEYLDTKKVGDTIEITVYRDGQKTTVKATLADWPR